MYLYALRFIMPYDFGAFAKFPTLFHNPCLWIVGVWVYFKRSLFTKWQRPSLPILIGLTRRKNLGKMILRKLLPSQVCSSFQASLKENSVILLFAICQFVWD